MRKVCLDMVYDLARKDERIFFIGSDLGIGTLKQFKFFQARLNPRPASQTVNTFVYPGTTPSISANGIQSAIVWAAENGHLEFVKSLLGA